VIATLAVSRLHHLILFQPPYLLVVGQVFLVLAMSATSANLGLSQQLASNITSRDPCPPECALWLRLVEPHLEAAGQDLRGTHSAFVYLVEASNITPRVYYAARECASDDEAAELLPALICDFAALEALKPIGDGKRASQEVTKGEEDEPMPELTIWGSYRGARLRLSHFMLVLLNRLMPIADLLLPAIDIRHERAVHQAIVDDMAVNILQSAGCSPEELQAASDYPERPLMPREDAAAEKAPEPSRTRFTWIEMMRLIWPLTVVARMGHVQPATRTQAERVLRTIGRDFGIRQALREQPIAPTDPYTPVVDPVDGTIDLSC